MAESIGLALLQRRAQVLRAKAEAGDEHAAALLAEQEAELSQEKQGWRGLAADVAGRGRLQPLG